MLPAFVILAVLVIAILAIFIIALVAHKLGFVDDNTFSRCSNISTIVGVPLTVIALVVAVAGLVRDGSGGGGGRGSPSPTPSVVVVNSSPSASPTVPPFNNQKPTPPPTPSPTPSSQQQEVTSETKPQPIPDPSPSVAATQSRYDRGDIGTRKENGYYEITLENAKVEPVCKNGFARVSNDEKIIAVNFSIRAVHLQVPSIPTGRDAGTYYLEDGHGRRYQMSCGDGRYFNVSLNSFEGKPKPKTLSIAFVVPITAQSLKFRFNPPAGDAVLLTLPSPL